MFYSIHLGNAKTIHVFLRHPDSNIHPNMFYTNQNLNMILAPW